MQQYFCAVYETKINNLLYKGCTEASYLVPSKQTKLKKRTSENGVGLSITLLKIDLSSH